VLSLAERKNNLLTFGIKLVFSISNIRPKMKHIFLYITVICLSFFVSLASFSRHKSTGLVQEILNQTNQFRRSKGLTNLIIMQGLNAIARKHSEDMAKGRIGFGHEGFAQRNVMANTVIKHMHGFAENVAYGPTTGKQVVILWKNSPGHRRNMLGHYKYTGIGIARDRQGRMYYTQVFAG